MAQSKSDTNYLKPRSLWVRSLWSTVLCPLLKRFCHQVGVNLLLVALETSVVRYTVTHYMERQQFSQ